MPKRNNLLKSLKINPVTDEMLKSVLPKKLTAKHLPELTKVLEDLARGLRHALRIYKSGKNGGRDGAIVALYTLQLVLLHFETFEREDLTVPLAALTNALQALDKNNQLPILTPPPNSGQASNSNMRSIMEGYAVVTVERLLRAGLSLNDGCDLVAKQLVKSGMQSTRSKSPISERTVRHWRQRASNDITNATPLSQAAATFLASNEKDIGTKAELVELAMDDLRTILSQFGATDYD